MLTKDKYRDIELDVVKNLDFHIRTSGFSRLLVAADYPKEGHLEVALTLGGLLEEYYGRDVKIIDLAKERNFKFTNNDEVILFVHDVKRNPSANKLYEGNIDGALIVRSKRSIGIKKKRFVSDLIKDANLPILGLILNQV